MDVWQGSIPLPPNHPLGTLHDVHLSISTSAPPPASSVLTHLRTSLSASSLSFASYLDPSRIPLFLACGPSLSLTTSSPQTQAFFTALFLSALPDESSPSDSSVAAEQCRVCMLLRVSLPAESDASDSGWGITELAVYGAVSYPSLANLSDRNIAPTPPNSSPPPPTPEVRRPVIAVHALPLSSRHDFARYLPVIKPEPQNIQAALPAPASPHGAVFIAPDPQDILNPFIPASTKKRRAAALDAAVEKRKKPRKSEPPPKIGGPLGLLAKNKLNIQMGVNMRKQGIKAEEAPPVLSRSSTIAGMVGPAFRRSSIAAGTGVRALSFSRAGSVSTDRPSTSSSLMRPKSSAGVSRTKTPKPEQTIPEAESRNRDALTRLVASVMKSYGLRDYKRERAKSLAPVEPPGGQQKGELAIPDDSRLEAEKAECKAVFQHAVRAASFALRGEFETSIVEASRMKSVVESLVAIFCAGRKYGENAKEGTIEEKDALVKEEQQQRISEGAEA